MLWLYECGCASSVASSFCARVWRDAASWRCSLSQCSIAEAAFPEMLDKIVATTVFKAHLDSFGRMANASKHLDVNIADC